jgi:hypothetical protein
VNPALRDWARRGLAGLVVGPVLAWSAWHVGAAGTFEIVPVPAPTRGVGPAPPWGVTLALVLVPAAAWSAPREGQGGVGLVSLAAGVLVPAAYPWSNLDWSVLLVDLGLAHGGAPPLGVVAVGLAPFGLAWVIHAAAMGGQTRARFQGKGGGPGEADAAAAVVHRWALVPAVGGGLGAGLLALGYRLATGLPRAGSARTPLALAAVTVAVVVWALRQAGPTEG